MLTGNVDAAVAQLLLGASADAYGIMIDDGHEVLRALQVVMAGERYSSARDFASPMQMTMCCAD